MIIIVVMEKHFSKIGKTYILVNGQEILNIAVLTMRHLAKSISKKLSKQVTKYRRSLPRMDCTCGTEMHSQMKEENQNGTIFYVQA